MAVIIYTSYIAHSSILEISIPQKLRDSVKHKLLNSSVRIACSAVQVYDSMVQAEEGNASDSNAFNNVKSPSPRSASKDTQELNDSTNGTNGKTYKQRTKSEDYDDEEQREELLSNNNGIDHMLFEKVEELLMQNLMDTYHRFYRHDKFKSVLEELSRNEKVLYTPTVTINNNIPTAATPNVETAPVISVSAAPNSAPLKVVWPQQQV